MARISKETYGKILETLGYKQHPANKTLYLMNSNGNQYGVDLKGKEPDVFKILEGMTRMNDLSDDIVKNTISVLANSNGNGRAKPVDLETEQEYCNAVPEVNEDETSTEPPQDEESVQEEEIPPSGSSVGDEPYHDEYLNEEPPMEVIEPEYEEPEVKKTKPAPVVQEGTAIFSCIQDLDLQLAEAGKIKIGKKRPPKPGQKASDFRAPMKLDHFVVTTTEFDSQTGDLIEDKKIMDKIGNDCRLLKICLPYDDINLNFQSSYSRYTKTKCLCRGDGKTARTAEGEIILCNPKNCQFAIDKQCKPTGILSVILEDAPSIGGVYKFRTTSWNSIRNIYSSLHFITSKITGGILAGIPLNMVLLPKTVQIPGGKGTTEIYAVNIEFPHSLAKMREMAKEEARLRAETLMDIKALEANAAKQLAMYSPSPEEVKEITEEFYPELHEA